MRVREGSIADKCIKASNWIDNTTAGNIISAGALATLVVIGFIYALLNYPV